MHILRILRIKEGIRILRIFSCILRIAILERGVCVQAGGGGMRTQKSVHVFLRIFAYSSYSAYSAYSSYICFLCLHLPFLM